MPQLIRWINQSSGHLGHRVFRSTSPMDPENLPAPIATVGPVGLGEWAEYVESEYLADGTYYYRVQPFDETGVGVVSDEDSINLSNAPDYAGASIGDAIGGGIFAGIDTIGGVDYYIIAGDAESEAYGLQWKTSQTTTPGTDSYDDGLANTQAMVTAGIADHPAGEHCVNYAGGGFNDWHLPSRSQLQLMIANLSAHTEFSNNTASGDRSWSSTEFNATQAYRLTFSDGSEGIYLKDFTSYRTRPIRRVAA
ncbi:DUF1566 domain-containing protein [Halomonas getboli]|uniref:Lcl domain-containing protein n=1 Tax=Halomonas getboli TaxID=2935862 RepID=UPI001FFF0682|nr:DUF1566 domain-containing protein [Halomonas getboli]MCK2183496.1 DUF1566 domain-containing protein [Halomonas getboli]